MATAEADHDELTKRDRILNALAVYPEDKQVSNQAIAELTGASASYVYQLRDAIDEGDLTEEAVEDARNDELKSRYRDRLHELIGSSDGQRTAGEDDTSQSESRPEEPAAPEHEANGTVAIEDVEQVRERMAQYRDDAAFERERFEGAGKNIAEEKYFIANRAIELLDEVIEA